jgi:hypothetical protein
MSDSVLWIGDDIQRPRIAPPLGQQASRWINLTGGALTVICRGMGIINHLFGQGAGSWKGVGNAAADLKSHAAHAPVDSPKVGQVTKWVTRQFEPL